MPRRLAGEGAAQRLQKKKNLIDAPLNLRARSRTMPATAHASYWHETAGGAATHYGALQDDIEVDVAIVGGGITGLTAAAWLQQSGRRVVLLESDQIGSGTSGFTSGHLDATTDLPLDEMISDFGQSAAAAITTV